MFGVSMDRGAAMHEAMRAGRPVEVEEVPSLADSLGGGIGMDNRLSFPICRDHLAGVILVTEEEIYRAMQALYFEDRLVAEGASVVGAAALLAGKLPAFSGPVATIVTGRNVDMAAFTDVVCGRDIQLGDYLVKGSAYGS
ncbi:pyridoxal-phosphate dependent enzyme [Mesorhizobium sp. ZMM04-4]